MNEWSSLVHLFLWFLLSTGILGFHYTYTVGYVCLFVWSHCRPNERVYMYFSIFQDTVKCVSLCWWVCLSVSMCMYNMPYVCICLVIVELIFPAAQLPSSAILITTHCVCCRCGSCCSQEVSELCVVALPVTRLHWKWLLDETTQQNFKQLTPGHILCY